jgi:hypothetical protein
MTTLTAVLLLSLVVALCASALAAIMVAADSAAMRDAPQERIDDDGDHTVDALDARDVGAVLLAADAPPSLLAAALARHRVQQRFQPILDLSRVDDDADVDLDEASYPVPRD